MFFIMKFAVTKNIIVTAIFSTFFIAGCLVLFALAKTWNKTEIEFRIHINKQLVRESTFGESPTFAIWLEEPETGSTQTIFVTNRAGLGDWEGKTSVPVALPKWFEVNKSEQQSRNMLKNKISERLTITGATPKPGYFSTRVRVTPGSMWNCWIEVNLAGDFNEKFKEYDEEAKTSDEYKTGQPALLYLAIIKAEEGNRVVPDIAGMCILDPEKGVTIQPLTGITNATRIFDEIIIAVARPKPRIVE
ncbi:MAG TPA: hypothetical protein DCP74_12690 [Bacteroidales bacterium]|nr:hypothetical protein [Bacteroidales bacterium]